MTLNPKARKRILIALAGTAAVLFLVFIFIYWRLLSLNKTFADYIENPGIILMNPEDLDPIEGTPDDIDEDFLHEVETPVEEAIYRQVPIDETVFNILLVGSDLRPDEGGHGRSDSMMLVSYDRETSDIRITSFMRDTWVAIPNRSSNRINAAFAYGGIGLAVNTVNINFDLDIQNYAIVEFEGLKKIVDELGGIEVMLTRKELERINSAHKEDELPLKDGRYRLNGAQTLTHARNRSTGDGDFGRTRRQRDVMMAILSKMKRTLNPVKLTGFLTEALKHLDTNIRPNTIFTLGLEVLSAGGGEVSQARIPFDGTWQYASKNGRSVVTIDLDENKSLLHEYLYGDMEEEAKGEN